jgi:hypothetical protein
MAKKSAWNSQILLARLLKSFNIIPPVVPDPKADRQHRPDCVNVACTCCCCCKCDDCRKKERESLLPRAADDGEPYPERLELIQDRADCVLGVLAGGYVLKGSGSVKSRPKKRA